MLAAVQVAWGHCPEHSFGRDTGPNLLQGRSAQVIDAGSGSATSGTDYTPFGTQTVTFAVGSTGGATDSVTLQPIDDAVVESAETVNLALQNLTNTLSGRASHGTTAGTVTINDNDTPNVAPVLAPVGNQTAPAGATSHVVNLSATDANNEPLLFGATVTKVEFYLDQLLNLTIHPQGVFEGLYGGGEKWLFSPGTTLSPNTLKWYYILPGTPEQLFEWDETPNALSGPIVSKLNPGTHADPTLLTNATATPVPATAGVAGNVLTVTKTPSFNGTVLVTAIVNDGRGGVDSEVFQLTFPPALPQLPPVLGTIGDRNSAPGANDIVINLAATDPNNDPLTFSVSLTTLELTLDQQLDLSPHPQGLFSNLYGGSEKWLYSVSSNKWYYILPNEQLFEWDETPSVLSGTQIATLNPGTHANPALLYDPIAVPATGTVVGNVLTITKTAGLFGSVLATVTVDDGNGGQDSETFKATFAPTSRSSARSSSGSAIYRHTVDALLSDDELLNGSTLDERILETLIRL